MYLRTILRNTLKALVADLKLIYTAVTEEEARMALEDFSTKWKQQYPQIAKSWYANWDNLMVFLQYPNPIRRVIYTTKTIGVPGQAWLNKEVEFLSGQGLTIHPEPSFAFAIAI